MTYLDPRGAAAKGALEGAEHLIDGGWLLRHRGQHHVTAFEVRGRPAWRYGGSRSSRAARTHRLENHVALGEWIYRHTPDPTYRPAVIRVPSPTRKRWNRWEQWKAGDPRWAFEVIYTDALTREQAAARVVTWIQDALAEHHQTQPASVRAQR